MPLPRELACPPYDAAFFEALREGTLRSAATVAPLLIELFQPKSVVDVGCGAGLWLSAFHERGVTDILGVDGPWVDDARLAIPPALFRRHDLGQSFEIDRTFDLALCLEVAEHLPPEAAPSLVRCLVRLAPIVVFSAAIPGQGGEGHLNERWPSYWSDLFASQGYGCSAALRRRLWAMAEVDVWYRQNILCFINRDHPEQIRRMNMADLPEPLDIAHPELYARATGDRERRQLYVDRLETRVREKISELNAAKAELENIKASRPWRLYQSVRPALAAARRVQSLFRIGARRPADDAD